MGRVFGAVLPLIIAGIVLWRGLRPVGARELRRFLDRFGVQVDEEAEELLTTRLRRSRALRSSGAAIGVLIAGLPMYLSLVAPGRAAAFAVAPVGMAWLMGAALGAILAEVLVVQRPLRGRHAAIEARQVNDLVSPVWAMAVRVLAATALVSFVVELRHADAELVVPAVGLLCAIVAVLGLGIGLRRVTDRSRLAPYGRLRIVDDALRSHGAHQVAGAAVALASGGLAMALDPLRAASTPLSLFVLGGHYLALGCWWSLAGTSTWRLPNQAPITP